MTKQTSNTQQAVSDLLKKDLDQKVVKRFDRISFQAKERWNQSLKAKHEGFVIALIWHELSKNNQDYQQACFAEKNCPTQNNSDSLAQAFKYCLGLETGKHDPIISKYKNAGYQTLFTANKFTIRNVQQSTVDRLMKELKANSGIDASSKAYVKRIKGNNPAPKDEGQGDNDNKSAKSQIKKKVADKLKDIKNKPLLSTFSPPSSIPVIPSKACLMFGRVNKKNEVEIVEIISNEGAVESYLSFAAEKALK